MRGNKNVLLLVGLLVAVTMLGLSARGGGDKKAVAGVDKVCADAAGADKADADKGNEAERQELRKASRAFVDAFGKGDAKAVAALWTERGECHEADGDVIVGRPAIEKAFAEFFEQNPKAKMEVIVKSIRFPSANMAIEEGVLRQCGNGNELPKTSLYSATHVREGGAWKIAVSREWGEDEDRLEDIDWLIGTWKAQEKDREVTLSFQRDAKTPFLVGEFTKKAGAKVTSTGTMKIGVDPQTGQLRSWHFDDDGGHGQSLWIRDNNNWVLDSEGVQADGTETASVNLLGRVSGDEITWRSIDRVLGDEELPDTLPVRLVRSKQ